MLDPDIKLEARCEILGRRADKDKTSVQPGSSFTIATASELRADSNFFNRPDSCAYNLINRLRCEKMIGKHKSLY